MLLPRPYHLPSSFVVRRGSGRQASLLQSPLIKSEVTWDTLQEGAPGGASGGGGGVQLPPMGRPSSVRLLFTSSGTWAVFLAHATYNFSEPKPASPQAFSRLRRVKPVFAKLRCMVLLVPQDFF